MARARSSLGYPKRRAQRRGWPLVCELRGRTGRVRTVGRRLKLKLVGNTRTIEVEIVARDGAIVRTRIDGIDVIAELEPLADGAAILGIDGRRIRISRRRARANSILVRWRGRPVRVRAGRGPHWRLPPRPGRAGSNRADAGKILKPARRRGRPGRARAGAGGARSDEDGNHALRRKRRNREDRSASAQATWSITAW